MPVVDFFAPFLNHEKNILNLGHCCKEIHYIIMELVKTKHFYLIDPQTDFFSDFQSINFIKSMPNDLTPNDLRMPNDLTLD